MFWGRVGFGGWVVVVCLGVCLLGLGHEAGAPCAKPSTPRHAHQHTHTRHAGLPPFGLLSTRRDLQYTKQEASQKAASHAHTAHKHPPTHTHATKQERTHAKAAGAARRAAHARTDRDDEQDDVQLLDSFKLRDRKVGEERRGVVQAVGHVVRRDLVDPHVAVGGCCCCVVVARVVGAVCGGEIRV